MKTLEVAYAGPQRQAVIEITVEESMSLERCVKASMILEQFPEINWEDAKVGVFGKVQPRDYIPKNGDRIEIYRPLTLDPMQKRRLKANNQTK